MQPLLEMIFSLSLAGTLLGLFLMLLTRIFGNTNVNQVGSFPEMRSLPVRNGCFLLRCMNLRRLRPPPLP